MTSDEPDRPGRGPALSVIVPAHNEERTIARGLDALVREGRRPDDEIIVVANGCTDRTADVVREHDAGIGLVDLAEASKREALETGRREASRAWHAYVDADVEVSLAALHATVDEMLEVGALVGAPTMRLDLRGARWYARSYARVWLALPWCTEEPVGSGVYVLAPDGLDRLGCFPTITNDDQYVHDLFVPAERRRARGATFEMRPPRDWRGLVSRRTRVTAGRRELTDRFGVMPGAAPRESLPSLLRREPRLARDVPVVLAVAVAAALEGRRRRRRSEESWARDESSREPVPPTAPSGGAPRTGP
ncbi:MAG: glycosyltransferase family 2 protein [Acidimicrobiales bacterium]|nr:glycosyltransferase family 2 protein [Acidimicrobiales bacterium]